MYESFYHFKEKPFSLLPDSHFLYHSSKHDAALAQLQYGLLSQAGFCVITGNIGTGKTTLIRYLLEHMEKDITLGLITNTHESFGEIIKWVSQAFGLEHSGLEKQTLYNKFTDFLIDEYAKGQHTVLIIDEAQNLSVETLEELRVISNINAGKDHVFQMILVGQLELKEKLMRPDMMQFAQRITASYKLEALTEDETEAYIRHRVQIAGGPPTLFTSQACQEVYRYSGGVPRLINTLCDTALVYGFAGENTFIDAVLIYEVACDKSSGGIFPIAVKPDEQLRPVVIEAEPVMSEETPPTDEPEVHDESLAEFPAKAATETTQIKDEVRYPENSEKTSTNNVTVADVTLHEPTEGPEKISQQSNKKPPSIRRWLIGAVLLITVIAALFYFYQQRHTTLPEPPDVMVLEREQSPLLETAASTTPKAALVQKIERKEPKAVTVENAIRPAGEKSLEIAKPLTEQKPMDSIKSSSWIMAQDSSAYTLHIASMSKRELARNFIVQYEMQADAAYFTGANKGVTWHSVMYGIYPDTASAIDASMQLPAEILSSKPWVRKVAAIKNRLAAP